MFPNILISQYLTVRNKCVFNFQLGMITNYTYIWAYFLSRSFILILTFYDIYINKVDEQWRLLDLTLLNKLHIRLYHQSARLLQIKKKLILFIIWCTLCPLLGLLVSTSKQNINLKSFFFSNNLQILLTVKCFCMIFIRI